MKKETFFGEPRSRELQLIRRWHTCGSYVGWRWLARCEGVESEWELTDTLRARRMFQKIAGDVNALAHGAFGLRIQRRWNTTLALQPLSSLAALKSSMNDACGPAPASVMKSPNSSRYWVTRPRRVSYCQSP